MSGLSLASPKINMEEDAELNMYFMFLLLRCARIVERRRVVLVFLRATSSLGRRRAEHTLVFIDRCPRPPTTGALNAAGRSRREYHSLALRCHTTRTSRLGKELNFGTLAPHPTAHRPSLCGIYYHMVHLDARSFSGKSKIFVFNAGGGLFKRRPSKFKIRPVDTRGLRGWVYFALHKELTAVARDEQTPRPWPRPWPRRDVPTAWGVLPATGAAAGGGGFTVIWLLNVSSAPWRRLCVASRVREDFKRTT